MAGGGGLVPQAIVLALGAGALGGPEALRLLLQFAGRSAAVDLAICVAAISLVTAPLLGTILLARFVRKTGAGGGAAATDLFAQVTATVSVGAAVLVSACLLVVPGGIDAVRLPIDLFAVKNQIVVTVLAVAITAAATGCLPCAVPLRRFFRGAGGGGGHAPAAPAPATTIKVVVFLVAVLPLMASGGFDARAPAALLFPEFHWRMVTLPAGVAIVTVAGTMLLVRCARRARSAAGAGGGVAALTR